jgi:hypothetical protein
LKEKLTVSRNVWTATGRCSLAANVDKLGTIEWDL